MKKRNCRRTDEEQTIHKTAVKIIKMPAETLVAMYEAAKRAGFSEETVQQIHIPSGPTVEDFMARIEAAAAGRGGIRQATVTKLRAIYDEMETGDAK